MSLATVSSSRSASSIPLYERPIRSTRNQHAVYNFSSQRENRNRTRNNNNNSGVNQDDNLSQFTEENESSFSNLDLLSQNQEQNNQLPIPVNWNDSEEIPTPTVSQNSQNSQIIYQTLPNTNSQSASDIISFNIDLIKTAAIIWVDERKFNGHGFYAAIGRFLNIDAKYKYNLTNYFQQHDKDNAISLVLARSLLYPRLKEEIAKREIFSLAQQRLLTPLAQSSNNLLILSNSIIPQNVSNIGTPLAPPMDPSQSVKLITENGFTRQPPVTFIHKTFQQDFITGLIDILQNFLQSFDEDYDGDSAQLELQSSLQLLNYPSQFLSKSPKYTHKTKFNSVLHISHTKTQSAQEAEIQKETKRTIKKCKANIKDKQIGKAARVLEANVDKQKPVSDLRQDPTFLQKIKDLHPESPNLVLPETLDLPNFVFLEQDILDQLKKPGQKQSANGWSSWTYELFNWVILSESTKQVLLLFTNFFNIIVSGKCRYPDIWNTYLLMAFMKEDGSPRPIAIGDFFIRFLSKMIVNKVLKCPEVISLLSHSQFGVGVKGGSEAIIHAITIAYDKICSATEDSESSDSSILSVDMKNAFNTISRQAILDSLLQHCPILVKYYIWSYGSSSDLLDNLGRFICKSAQGVRQGDPLGPLLFCLGIGTILKQINTNYPGIDLKAFLDDIFMDGKTNLLEEAFIPISNSFRNIGLIFNIHKCTHFTNSMNYMINIPVPHIVDSLQAVPLKLDGIKVLGMPVGSQQFVKDFSNKLVDRYTRTVKFVSSLDVPDAFVLTRLCINSCPNYLTRCVKTDLISDVILRFDNIIDDLIAYMAGEPTLNPMEKIVRHLPCKLGGLGISAHSKTAKAAWTASFYKAAHLFESRSPRSFNYIMATKETYNSFDDNYEKQASQKDLTQIVNNGIYESFLPTINNPRAKAVFLSAATSGTANFLNSTFTNSLSLSNIGINSTNFQEGLRFRLLMLPANINYIQCQCAGEKDSHHMFHCRKHGWHWTQRHDLIKKALYHLIKKVRPQAIVNMEQNLSRFKSPTATSTAQEFRADIVFNEGLEMAILDVSIVDPSSTKPINNNSHSIAGVAAVTRETEKINKAKGFLPQEMANKFVPFVMESTGRIGKKAAIFLDKICSIDRLDFDACEIVKLERKRFINTVNHILVNTNANVARLCRRAVFRI